MFLVYLLKNRHNTNTHAHIHTRACTHSPTPTIHLPSPAGRYTWFTGTSQKKKKKKNCYHSNHMVLAWHSGHCHGNSRTDKWAVPGQAGLGTCTRVYTHIQDFFGVHCSKGPASVSSPGDPLQQQHNATKPNTDLSDYHCESGSQLFSKAEPGMKIHPTVFALAESVSTVGNVRKKRGNS